MKVHTATRRTIRHGLMLLWFADLINVTEEVTIVTSSVTCSLLKIFLYNSQSGQIHYYCIFYIILQSWQKNFSLHCTGTMRVGQSLYKSDDMQALCETCAPHLFYILISTIVSADRHATSERHSHSQQQRIVALLHKLPTCLKFCHQKNKKLLHFI